LGLFLYFYISDHTWHTVKVITLFTVWRQYHLTTLMEL